jgi:hypothetical protein
VSTSSRDRRLTLGGLRPLDGGGASERYAIPPEDLTTHAAIVGMTGSGKTGLVMVTVEEALAAGVPVVMIDVKGDLPNLALRVPTLAPAEFEPWIDASAAKRLGTTREALAAGTAARISGWLADWGLGPADVARLHDAMAVRVLTPGTRAGEPLHVLSALEQPSRSGVPGVEGSSSAGSSASPSNAWETDEEAARESLSAAISLLLRLVGRDPDPTKSRDHVVLSIFAERRLRAGQAASVEHLLADVRDPPVESLGAMPIAEFLPKRERTQLATALNTLLASPTFEAWRMGSPLDVDAWLAPRPDGRASATIVSVAHLDEDERSLVLGVVLEQFLAWVRAQPGTHHLRALLVFDEVFGFAPPHPANPPTKRPLLSLMKQARAYGVGVLLATQNPMDLDYRVLSNAGVWFVGRLQTDADPTADSDPSTDEPTGDFEPAVVTDVIKRLAPRWFVARNVHRAPSLGLLQSRTTLTWLRGPMTRADLRRVTAGRGSAGGAEPSASRPTE